MFAPFLFIISINTLTHTGPPFIWLQSVKCLEIYCSSDFLENVPASRVLTPAFVDDVEDINFKSKFRLTGFAVEFHKYLPSGSNAVIKYMED